MHTKLETTQEAVELALYLAITADCNELSAKALRQAKDFAADLTEAEMIDAKANVSRQVDRERLTQEMMDKTLPKLDVDPYYRQAVADLTEAEMIDAKANVLRQVELERFTLETVSKLEADPNFADEMADKIFTNNRYITEGDFFFSTTNLRHGKTGNATS